MNVRLMASVYESLQNATAYMETRPAVIHSKPGNTTVVTSFEQLARKGWRFAAFVSETEPEVEIIPLYLAKSADCIAAMFGCLAAGKMFSVLNRKMRPPQIENVLKDTKSPVLFVDGPSLMSLHRDLAQVPGLARVRWIVLKDPAVHPIHERRVQRMATERALSVLDLEGGDWDNSSAPPRAGQSRLAAGCCLFTSGSTGRPKGVLISADDLLRRADAEIKSFGLTGGDVLLSILPFSFDVGLNQLLASIRIGAPLVLLESWLPADILAAVERFGVTGISGVPSLWRGLINARVAFDTSGSHATLRYVTVSGGSLSRVHLEQLARLVGKAGIIKTYGQTEAFRSTCLLPQDLRAHPESVGRPFEGVHVYVADEDNRLCVPGEVGQVVHTGLGTMLGYLSDGASGKLVANPFRSADDRAEKAVYTGDYGYLDEDGFLYLKGRQDEMLKVSGNRVYPAEIVDKITDLDEVAEAEVVGVEGKGGETFLVAFAVAASGADPDERSIERALAARLPTYMLPSSIVFLTSMPLTANGKSDNQELRRRARSLLAEESFPLY